MILNTIKNLSNHLGLKVNKKVIVFLVDDYGTIRISSSKALNYLDQIIPNTSENRFNKFDEIASSSDLSALFEVLTSVKDKNGNHAAFTPMTVVANPNFKEIEASGLEEYHYESFYETLQRIQDGNEIKRLWKEGIEQGIFVPEFHGREHLNVRFWLEYLQKKDRNILEAFNHQSIGIDPTSSLGKGYMAAFDLIEENHLQELDQIAEDGLNLFEKLFGYRSVLFTPSALIHNDGMHEDLKMNGVKLIDMARLRTEPKFNGKSKKRFHYMGQKNKFGQRYITRNVMFEPNKDNKDSVTIALKEIDSAFKYKKPAIISSHRVNFVGARSEKNRDKGLTDLKNLLFQIVKQWPEVEFMTIRTLTI